MSNTHNLERLIMISKKLCAAALTLAIGSITAAAHAAPVTYTFAATVDHVNGYNGAGDNTYGDLAGLHVELGDKVIGSITWDAATAISRSDSTPTSESYDMSAFSIEYTFLSGRNSYAIAQAADVDIYNDAPNDGLIFSVVSTRRVQGVDLSALSALAFGDPAGNLWSSTGVPTSIDTALGGKYANLVGSVWENTGTPGDAGFSFGASLTSLQLQSVSPVPEPGTYAMLLAGLGAVGMVARRRRNNAV